MYRLKKGQQEIEVVDGPMAGRRFLPGIEYQEIPEAEKARFDKTNPPAGKPQAVPKAEKEEKPK
mgnify:CR=1 FL=1